MKEASKMHALVDYIITKLVTQQKLYKGSIVLDFTDLCTETEDVDAYPQEVNNVKVKFNISTEWDFSKENISIDEIFDEEGEDDEQGSSGNDTQGH